jgi:hypothetical protein
MQRGRGTPGVDRTADRLENDGCRLVRQDLYDQRRNSRASLHASAQNDSPDAQLDPDPWASDMFSDPAPLRKRERRRYLAASTGPVRVPEFIHDAKRLACQAHGMSQ